MERVPAFRKKIRKSEDSPAKRVEGPLRSLEDDKAQIAGFNFALTTILDGGIIQEAQLQALISPRFNGILLEIS